jgi:hypothetical protein
MERNGENVVTEKRLLWSVRRGYFGHWSANSVIGD